MALRAYGNKRDDNEAELVKVFERLGCSVYPLDKPADLLIGIQGRTFLVEVKAEKGRQTKDQVEFQMSWRGQYDIVRNEDDVIQFVCCNRSTEGV